MYLFIVIPLNIFYHSLTTLFHLCNFESHMDLNMYIFALWEETQRKTTQSTWKLHRKTHLNRASYCCEPTALATKKTSG